LGTLAASMRSTRPDAECIFGAPAHVSRSSGGTVICGWSYSHAGSKVQLITFRRDGTYDRVTEHTSGSEIREAK
jgi:hypothetical protein